MTTTYGISNQYTEKYRVISPLHLAGITGAGGYPPININIGDFINAQPDVMDGSNYVMFHMPVVNGNSQRYAIPISTLQKIILSSQRTKKAASSFAIWPA